MPETNIKLKSMTGRPLDFKIDFKYHPQALYGKVYWKIMENKFGFVEYKKATPDILSELNNKLERENQFFWKAESDNDGDVVYVYRPNWGKYDNQSAEWTLKFPPTEYAVGGPEEAKSYYHPSDMQDYNNLVLIVKKPSEEKKLDYLSMYRGDYTTYTKQEFINKFGEWEWDNEGVALPISIAPEEIGARGYVKIPKRSFTEYLWGYLEEGSEVNYSFKKIPHLHGGGKRKYKRKKSKKRKSKKRKSRTRRKSR